VVQFYVRVRVWLKTVANLVVAYAGPTGRLMTNINLQKRKRRTDKMNLSLPWEPLFTQSGEHNVNTDSLFGYYSLASTIGFTLAVLLFELYLDARQKSCYQKTQFPKQLEQIVGMIDVERHNDTTEKSSESEQRNEDKDSIAGDESASNKNKPLLPRLQEKFKSAQVYGLDKVNFGMVACTYDVVESVLFLILGFLPFSWDLSCSVGSKFGWSEQENEIKISLIFLFLTTVIGTITSLPFELYSTFQIERKHGFNKQTPGLFFSDKIKSLVLTFVIGGPFLAFLLFIIKVGHF